MRVTHTLILTFRFVSQSFRRFDPGSNRPGEVTETLLDEILLISITIFRFFLVVNEDPIRCLTMMDDQFQKWYFSFLLSSKNLFIYFL